jgi:putative alpha-1,2-mannosidase
MRIPLLLMSLLSLLLLAATTSATPILPRASPPPKIDPLSFIDSRIGTGGEGFGVGSIPIAAQVPFGSMRVGPDTLGLLHSDLEFNHFSGYYYGDHIVRAFSHTRLVGAGVSDYGSVGIMPTRPPVSPTSAAPDGARAAFKKSTEAASPGRYDVRLESIGVNVSLAAAGPFTALHLYTNTQTQPLSLQFDFAHAAGTLTPNSTASFLE